MAAFGIQDQTIADALAELDAMEGGERESFQRDRVRTLSDGQLVEYVDECVREATESMRERKDRNRMLWQAYETEMSENSLKDDWQAKIVVNDPFTACYQAKALVRKAVAEREHQDYFDVQPTTERRLDPLSKAKARFWKDVMRYWCRQSGFNPLFPDMAEMGFVIGLSLGVKLVWEKDDYGRSHLRLHRIRPGNIHYDPTRRPRESQGGLYCIHEEWVDYHLLLKGQEAGLYENVEEILREDNTDESSHRYLDREDEEQERRFYNRNRFRKAVLVREFYGDVLDHNSELTLPKQRFLVANRTVIRRPTAFPLPTIRWPIHQFAPMPHLTKFHGMALTEGVMKLWKLRNNLLNLTVDNMNFVMNSAYEVRGENLQDPADTDLFPGALKRLRPGAHGQAYMEIPRTLKLGEVAGLWDLTDKQFQRGSFVTELVRGDLGGRRTTAREVEIKTQQATGVFDSVGKDVEYGGIGLLKMIMETVGTMWDPTDYPDFGAIAQAHQEYLAIWEQMDQRQRAESMAKDTDIKLSGVSAVLERESHIARLQDALAITADPRFAQMVDGYQLMKKYLAALDILEVVKPEEEAVQPPAPAMDPGGQGDPSMMGDPGMGGQPPPPPPQPPPMG